MGTATRTRRCGADSTIMGELVERIDRIDRAECRRHVEQSFSVERIVGAYERCYAEVLGRRRTAT
jgi:hypothetical protein